METESVQTIDPWLAQFQPQVQPLVAAWFHYAIWQGARSPETVLTIIERVVSRKMEWSIEPRTRELCRTVLLALCHQRDAARGHAAQVLARTADSSGKSAHGEAS